MADWRVVVRAVCLVGSEVMSSESKDGMIRRLICGEVGSQLMIDEMGWDGLACHGLRGGDTYVVTPHPTVCAQLRITERQQGMAHIEVLEL